MRPYALAARYHILMQPGSLSSAHACRGVGGGATVANAWGLESRTEPMPIAARFILTIVMCTVASSDAAMAQGAATGGTKDVGSPTMVFPVRPRDEPAQSTAVPNVPQSQQRVIRLRRPYYYYGHRYLR
jgi:hypothetical protein